MKKLSIRRLLYFVIGLVSCLSHAETVRYKVAGISMEPTLITGDVVEVNRRAYDSIPPAPGDLVSVRFDVSLRPMVKRVAAVADEQLRFDQQGLWRDQELIVGSARFNRIAKRGALEVQLENYNSRVPSGNVIVLGDNPRNSKDSLRYGFVSHEQIEGKVESINGLSIVKQAR